MMKEYFKNPVETNQIKKLHADGIEWIHTGDLGTIDEDGFMYIKGRIKRIYGYIDDSGNTYKIFPDYIENTVSGIEGVKPDVSKRISIYIKSIALFLWRRRKG